MTIGVINGLEIIQIKKTNRKFGFSAFTVGNNLSKTIGK